MGGFFAHILSLLHYFCLLYWYPKYESLHWYLIQNSPCGFFIVQSAGLLPAKHHVCEFIFSSVSIRDLPSTQNGETPFCGNIPLSLRQCRALRRGTIGQYPLTTHPSRSLATLPICPPFMPMAGTEKVSPNTTLTRNFLDSNFTTRDGKGDFLLCAGGKREKRSWRGDDGRMTRGRAGWAGPIVGRTSGPVRPLLSLV